METFLKKVGEAISHQNLIESGDKVLAAVSGGADSMALLASLDALSDSMGFQLAVAHFNHGARGEASDADARHVSEWALKIGLQCILDKQNVQGAATRSRGSFQETARRMRYAFLRNTAEVLGANKIALGHTMDDQAETVLINLLRGSGLLGLSGMKAKRLPFIRPLLQCRRIDILRYLSENNIAFREDITNTNPKYLRNRIRLELIPYMESKYNSNFRENLFRMAELLEAEEDYLARQTRQAFDQMARFDLSRTRIQFVTQDVVALPEALQRRLIREAVRALKGDLRRISRSHIDDLLGCAHDPGPGKILNLPKGIGSRCDRHQIEIYKIQPPKDRILIEQHVSYELRVPGEVFVPESGLCFKARFSDVGNAGEGGEVFSPYRACFDGEKTGGRIHVRFFRPGDRFVPLGMQGTKKLHDFFIDAKVPREDRRTIPILTTQDGLIIWVYGMRISEHFRKTGNTRKVLCVEGLTR